VFREKPLAWFFWLLLGLLLPALACAGWGVEPAPAAQNGRAATLEPYVPPGSGGAGSLPGSVAPPASGVADADAFFSVNRVSDTLAGLGSYRMQIQLRYTAVDGGTDQWLTAQTVYLAQPAASSVTLHFGDSAQSGAADTLTLVQLGNHSFTVIPGGGCLSGAGSGTPEDNPFAELTTPDTFLRGLSGAQRRLPDEVIHGTAVRHYTFDQSSLQELPGQIRSLEGHIYVAQEGGYVVRLTLVADGREITALGQKGEGRFTMEINVFDVNEPLVVLPPAACSEAAEAPYPVLPDATELTVLPDLFTYRSHHSFSEAVIFYRQQMAAAGWTAVGEEVILEQVAFLQFSKNDVPVTVNISEESGSGLVAVLILRE
jgi:hypothetical protein